MGSRKLLSRLHCLVSQTCRVAEGSTAWVWEFTLPHSPPPFTLAASLGGGLPSFSPSSFLFVPVKC